MLPEAKWVSTSLLNEMSRRISALWTMKWPPARNGSAFLSAPPVPRSRVLVKEGDLVRIGRAPEPFADHLRLMVEVDADLPLADGGELPEDDPDERPAEKRQQRLRDVVRYRPEPLAETGCGEEYVERDLGHGDKCRSQGIRMLTEVSRRKNPESSASCVRSSWLASCSSIYRADTSSGPFRTPSTLPSTTLPYL